MTRPLLPIILFYAPPGLGKTHFLERFNKDFSTIYISYDKLSDAFSLDYTTFTPERGVFIGEAQAQGIFYAFTKPAEKEKQRVLLYDKTNAFPYERTLLFYSLLVLEPFKEIISNPSIIYPNKLSFIQNYYEKELKALSIIEIPNDLPNEKLKNIRNDLEERINTLEKFFYKCKERVGDPSNYIGGFIYFTPLLLPITFKMDKIEEYKDLFIEVMLDRRMTNPRGLDREIWREVITKRLDALIKHKPLQSFPERLLLESYIPKKDYHGQEVRGIYDINIIDLDSLFSSMNKKDIDDELNNSLNNLFEYLKKSI